MVKKTTSSRRWLQEHFADGYVKRKQLDGYRARSVYKLIEIQNRYKIVHSGDLVIELGAAPGGWSAYLRPLLGGSGRLIAVDLLPMAPIVGVEFLQGDFRSAQLMTELRQQLANKKIDFLFSDMAPNLSGIQLIDQARVVELVNTSFNFACSVLKQGGGLLVKCFHSATISALLPIMQNSFVNMRVVKPDASRARSSEFFLLLLGFKGGQS